jgi:hypothetical protein
MVALGNDITGLFSNNHDLTKEVKKAAFEAGEKMWELPLEKEYKEMNKSEIADIANIPNSRYGGAITAALFLEEFVDGKTLGTYGYCRTGICFKSNRFRTKRRNWIRSQNCSKLIIMIGVQELRAGTIFEDQRKYLQVFPTSILRWGGEAPILK